MIMFSIRKYKIKTKIEDILIFLTIICKSITTLLRDWVLFLILNQTKVYQRFILNEWIFFYQVSMNIIIFIKVIIMTITDRVASGAATPTGQP